MFAKKNTAPSILFFTKNNIQWWNDGATEIQSFQFPADTVVDMEVVNEETMQTSFQEWLDQTQPQPKDVIVIFAEEICFSKNFPVTTDKQGMDGLATGFVESVPFDNVLSKQFSLGAEIKVVALNKDLYEVFIKTLEEKQFYIKSMFPDFIFGADFSQGLTVDLAKSLSSQLEALAVHDLIDPKKRKDRQQKEFIKKQFAITKEVGIAIGFFIFLIAVLIVLIWNMNRQNETLKKPTPSPSPVVEQSTAPRQSPIASTSAEEASESASPTDEEFGDLQIQVLNGSGISGKADEVRQSLEAVGAGEVSTGNATQTNTGNTIVVIRLGLSQLNQELLQEALEQITEDFVIQQNSELEVYDVIITIGQDGLLNE